MLFWNDFFIFFLLRLRVITPWLRAELSIGSSLPWSSWIPVPGRHLPSGAPSSPLLAAADPQMSPPPSRWAGGLPGSLRSSSSPTLFCYKTFSFKEHSLTSLMGRTLWVYTLFLYFKNTLWPFQTLKKFIHRFRIKSHKTTLSTF